VRLKGIFEEVSSQISPSHIEASHSVTFLSAAETFVECEQLQKLCECENMNNWKESVK